MLIQCDGGELCVAVWNGIYILLYEGECGLSELCVYFTEGGEKVHARSSILRQRGISERHLRKFL